MTPIQVFAVLKRWAKSYVVPTNAVPLPLPRNQLAADVQTTLQKADNEPAIREQAINAKQTQIEQLNTALQQTNSNLQTTDQNLSGLNTNLVAVNNDLQKTNLSLWGTDGDNGVIAELETQNNSQQNSLADHKQRIENLESDFTDHVENEEIHITELERQKWNNGTGSGSVDPSDLISTDTPNALITGSDDKLKVIPGSVSPADLISTDAGNIIELGSDNKLHAVAGSGGLTQNEVKEIVDLHNEAVDAHDDIRAGINSANDQITSLWQAENNLESKVNTEIQNRINGDNALQIAVDEARVIAEGRARAKVFADTAEMNDWLLIPVNTDTLNIGDNLFIVAREEPDYWWDGTQAQKLETQKVDLTEYYTKAQIDLLLTSKVDLTTFNNSLALKADNTQSVTPTDAESQTKFGTSLISQTISNWLLQIAQKINGLFTIVNKVSPKSYEFNTPVYLGSLLTQIGTGSFSVLEMDKFISMVGKISFTVPANAPQGSSIYFNLPYLPINNINNYSYIVLQGNASIQSSVNTNNVFNTYQGSPMAAFDIYRNRATIVISVMQDYCPGDLRSLNTKQYNSSGTFDIFVSISYIKE